MGVESRIISASVRIDSNTGIRTVEFVSEGVPEWPTALNPEYTLFDDPTLAFRNGPEAAKLPLSYNYSPARRRFACASIMSEDGSALDLTQKKLLRTYAKNVEFSFPGRASVYLDTGPKLEPPTTLSVPAKISIWLLDEKSAQSIEEPYQVKEWATFGATYVPSATLVGVSESAGARGYLSGDSWVGINTEYKGMEVEGAVGWVQSTPTYDEFVAAISEGRTISRNIYPLLSLADGTPLFLLTETFVKYTR